MAMHRLQRSRRQKQLAAAARYGRDITVAMDTHVHTSQQRTCS